jgi:N-acetylmuramoyl-L-alanine amidase
MNAMPSVLIETGFINHPEESHYMASEKGQKKLQKVFIMQLLIIKKQLTENQFSGKKPEPDKLAEVALKNDFRILLMSSPKNTTTEILL